MSRQRRSYETGHKPKLLVVIDETEECDRAVYFASRRAARIGGNVVMLRVVETLDQGQQWLGVADIMRAEAHEEASAELAKYAARAESIGGITPEQALREGDKAEEILKLIDEDEDIFILVLGACASAEGPGRSSPLSAVPPAIIRFPSPSCPATFPTRRLTPFLDTKCASSARSLAYR